MVSSQDSRHWRFTVSYPANSSVLARLLDNLARFGLEPAWLFTRLEEDGAFRLDVRVKDLSPQRADTLAARIGNLCHVTEVQYEETGEHDDIQRTG